MVNQAVKTSFKNGKLDQTAVKKFTSLFKQLEDAEAIFSLTHYLKGLKLETEKYTLSIESKEKLTPQQVSNIATSLKKDYQFTEIINTVNPSLLGGFKVKIADVVFDSSLFTKILMIGEAING